MDDYTLQQELEALAGNAFNAPDPDNIMEAEPISKTMFRWQKLFNIPQDDVVDRIMEHRNNLTRTRISDAHWDVVRVKKEAAGYDQEAYEFELDLQKKNANLANLVPTDDASTESSISYLVELSGPLDSAEKVQSAAKLDWTPPVVKGNSTEDGRPVSLCAVTAAAKAEILCWASAEGGGFEPMILVDPRSLR